jgi:hypothetical protein
MKYIREKIIIIGKDGKPCRIFIEEYATIYRVSAKFVGWALCFVEGLSFPKRSTSEQEIVNYVKNLNLY